MPQTAMFAAWIAGLLGGLHCLAMCGAYVTIVQGRATVPLEPRRDVVAGQAAAHAGRMLTYVLLGTLFGAAGGTAFAQAFSPLQRGLYVAANVMLLLLAWGIAHGRTAPSSLEALGLKLYSALAPAAGRALRGRGIASRFALGALWGLTPCALVYGVLPVALFAGSAGEGALVMLAFGLGTLPNLLAAGAMLGGARRLFAHAIYRYVAGGVVAAFALAGLYRAWFVPSALGQGPFCLFQ